jgi:hypothetical protein
VLPNLATLLVPPGATGDITVTVEAVTSPMMDNLAPEVTTDFKFLSGVPKLRVLLPQRPTKLVRLAIAIPNLTQLLPATHNLVIALLRYEAESDDEDPHAVLGPVVGEVCEENTAVCLFLMPGWFNDVSGSGVFQVQIGIGRAPDNPQQVTLHWWDRISKEATAFAAEERWHLWTFTNPSPTVREVSPDASNRLHVGGTITLESNLSPQLAPPLPPPLALAITSDFGPRPPVEGNASASTYHEAVDFRAAVGTDVNSVLSGFLERVQNNGEKKCGSNLKYVNIRSGSSGELLVRYLHLSEILTPSPGPGVFVGPGSKLGRSGKSGTCGPHLDVRMQFKDEFKAEGTVDPWPLIANKIDRFMLTDGDPIVTTECPGCREIFDFYVILYVTNAKYVKPGTLGVLPSIGDPQVINWPKPATAYDLTSEDGTFDLSQYPKEVTNGKYVLLLSLCSESIGGCRKLRDWKITATDPSCPDDPSPNVEVFSPTTGIVLEAKPVVSYTYTNPDSGASVSATGSKGNVHVSASIAVNPDVGSSTGIAARYRDTFIVTSPGKEGQVGQATASFSVGSDVNISCSALDDGGPSTRGGADALAVYYFPGSAEVVAGRYTVSKSCGNPTTTQGSPTSSQSMSFTYGARHYFEVVMNVSLTSNSYLGGTPSSATSTAGIGYSVTANDPDAKVTWCRTPAPTP